MLRENTDIWSTDKPEPLPGDPDCPVCRGAGFVYPRLPSGKPDFSRLVACECRKGKGSDSRVDSLLNSSNLGSLSRYTFDNLMPDGRSGHPASQAQFRRLYDAAKAYADNPQGWLIIIGPSGCGKTHLAAALANQCIASGMPVIFQPVPDLLDHLRSAFMPDSEVFYDELFEQVRNIPLLVLDDLGVQASTPWAQEKLDQLLTHRFNNELPTVLTTSIALGDFDDRLRTRITDSRISHCHIIEEKTVFLTEYEWETGFELQKTMTFRNFDWKRANLPANQRQNLEMVYRGAYEFAQSPEGWLVLLGETGCGKTHLAAAIANYRYQAAKSALFVVVPDFLDHLRSTFSPESRISYDQLFERVKRSQLLILDDFGEQSTTPWAQEKLYQVINYRYNARLPMVITSRFSLDQMAGPVSSRLVDPKISLLWNIIVPDYRGDARRVPSKATPRPRGRKSG